MITFPEVPPGEDLTISASAYLDFLRCPERCNARYRGEYGPSTVRGFTGQLAHRMFARHLRSGPVADEEFDRACREEIGQGLNVAMQAAGVMRPSVLQPVIAEVKALMGRFDRLPRSDFIEAEVDLEAEPAPGLTLRGRIDALFGPGHRLIDWKTGSLGDAADQLRFYALVWTLDRGSLPDHLEALSVVSGERFAVEPAASDVEDTAGKVADMAGTLRAGWAGPTELDRVGGPWCSHCPILDGCPEGRAAASVAVPGGRPGSVEGGEADPDEG